MWFSWFKACYEGAVKLLARVAVTNAGSTQGRWDLRQGSLPRSLAAAVL